MKKNKKKDIWTGPPKRVVCPSFIGFTEDGTLIANGDDKYIQQHPEQKWVKLDRRRKGKHHIYRKINCGYIE